jgi:hypothetical protein
MSAPELISARPGWSCLLGSRTYMECPPSTSRAAPLMKVMSCDSRCRSLS